MSLRLFRPAVDSKGQFSVNGADILGHLDLSFGLVLDVGRGILPLGTPSLESVNTLFAGTFHFNIGLFNALALGLQVPIAIMDGPSRDMTNSVGGLRTGRPYNYQGLGDLAVHAKFRLLRAEQNPIGLAAILQAGIPTGDTAARNFVGDPGFWLWPQAAIDWQPSRRFRTSLNGGYRFISGVGARLRPTTQAVDFTYDDQVTFGLGISYRLALGSPGLDLVGEFYGAMPLSAIGNPIGLSAEAVGGLKLFVERNSYLYVGGGAGIPAPQRGYSAAAVRGFLAFIFEPSIGDRDGDGIKDDVDRCPDDPEDHDDFQDEDGCPEPDNDRDGILDADDECPLIPEDRDGDQDQDGCPEGDEGDRDADGIQDAVDRCPDDPEDRDGFQDEDGCPEPDNDSDGIPDQDDTCPNEPEDRDNFDDTDGCPDPDNDRDRIADRDDHCPNEPETYNGVSDEDGCPDRGAVQIEDTSITILQKIYFETDSAVIQPRSFPLLEQIAATLRGNPQIVLVQIQGHADERATDEYNIRLTRDRAASVREQLLQRGVEAARVHSAGYGERCPVDPRHNEQAWERNRRVEFKILMNSEGPTGAEVACPAGRDLIPPEDRNLQPRANPSH